MKRRGRTDWRIRTGRENDLRKNRCSGILMEHGKMTLTVMFF